MNVNVRFRCVLPILLGASVMLVAPLPLAADENCDALLAEAQQALGRNQPDGALGPLLEAKPSCPSNPQVYDLLGIAYDMQNHPAQALEAHRRAVLLAPNWPSFRNNLALSYLRAGKSVEAKAEFEHVMRLDPHNELASVNLASLCLHGKQYRQALAYLRNAQAESSTDASTTLDLAQAYFGVGETAAGVAALNRIATLAPSDEKLRFAAGLLLAENRQYAVAATQFEAIPVEDRDFAVCQNLGLAYSRLRRHEEAQKAFEQALRLDPANPDSYLGLGLDMLQSRKTDEAVYALSQARQKAPQRVDVACALIDALVQTGDFVRARDLLAEVQPQFPGNPAVLMAAGDLDLALGENAKALDEYQCVCQSEPGNLQARLSLAKAELKLGQTSPARAAFDQVLKADPQNPEAHAGLGHLALAVGHEDLALGELQRAVGADPDELEANEDLSEIATHRSEFAQARTSLETLTRLDPQNARYHYLLGRVLLKLGENDHAQQEFARSEALGKSSHKVPRE